MAKFNMIFQHLIETEYINEEDTKYGISQDTAELHGYNKDIIDLTLEEASYIYEHFYFNKHGFDKIQNTKIAQGLFDFTINTGCPTTAVKFLQRAYNSLNKNILLVVDGVLDEKTAYTINNYKFYKSLFKTMNILQGAYFISKVETDDTTMIISDKTFFRGWIEKMV